MIQLAFPLALLALAAIPLIIVLHLLRPRPRQVRVSSTALWQAAHKERERGLGLRRLLRNLSLLLLLAIALLLGFGLAGPQWLAHTSERADTVLVLDVSASMKTRAGIGTTRFDQALAAAADIVNGLPREGRMLVMTSGRKAVLRSGFETDRSTLEQVLAKLRPTDEAGRPREALALALSLLRGREHGRVYFLTDGAFDAGVDPRSPQVVFRIVGGPARNVAITRFDIRPELARDDRFQVLMTVRNYTDAPVVVPAAVSLDARPLFSRSFELKPREQQTIVLPFGGRARGPAVARIDVDDDLAADNHAFAAAPTASGLRVLLFTAGNAYLQFVLEALPGIALVTREWSPSADLAALARAFDVIAFDGIATPKLPGGNFLLINTVAPELPFSDQGAVLRPQIVGSGTSALMRDLDLTAVRIGAAKRVTINEQSGGLQRLFWSRETDLALALIAGDVKLIYLGFDLAQSNFPLQVAFPLFFSQSLQWLRPRGDEHAPTHIAAGSNHSIEVPAGTTQVIVRTPSGHAATLAVNDGAVAFDDTAAAGIYQYTLGEVTRHFAVSLTDALESDIDNRWRQDPRPEQAEPASGAAQALVPLWPYLLVLALLLIALEWCLWTWSRRSA